MLNMNRLTARRNEVNGLHVGASEGARGIGPPIQNMGGKYVLPLP